LTVVIADPEILVQSDHDLRTRQHAPDVPKRLHANATIVVKMDQVG
jgi:hypothetical protein